MIVSDNGTELTSNAMLKWQQDRRVESHYIALGKPMQNGLVKSFIGQLRTNASTSICSAATAMPERSSRDGGSTTI